MQPNHSPVDFLSLEGAIDRHPLIVAPETPLCDVIVLMSQARGSLSDVFNSDSETGGFTSSVAGNFAGPVQSSSVLVMAASQLIGVFTEPDLVKLVASGQNLEGVTVAEVMTRQVATLKATEFNDIFTAFHWFRRYQIRHLPLVDDQNQLVGLVTPESLCRVLQPSDWLRLRRVEDVMITQVIHAPTTMSVLQLAKLMAQHQVSCIAIAEKRAIESQEEDQEGKKTVLPNPQTNPSLLSSQCSSSNSLYPVGLITEQNIIQSQALEVDLRQLPAQMIISKPLFCLNPEDSLWDAHQQMQQHQLQQMMVAGSQGELLGIVTQSNLLQVLNPIEMYKVLDVWQRKVSQLEAEKAELLQGHSTHLKQQVKARTAQLQGQAQREHLLAQVALRIRQSLNLDDILNSTVTEVRQFLQADRVLVYQFAPNWDGSIMAESVAQGWRVSLGTQIQDTCFQKTQGGEYRQGRKRAIADIYQAGLTRCHLQLLERFQVKANLVVPILMAEQLWGLLVVHQCTGVRQWQDSELDLLEQLGVQIAIAIQQAKAFEQIQTELVERQRVENALQQLAGELELRVQNRTVELANAIISLRITNEKLQQEIAEREQTQKKLLIGKEQLQYLLSSSPTVIYSCKPEPDYRLTFLSENFTMLLGYEARKSLKSDNFWINCIHPEDAPRFLAELSFLLQGDGMNTVEYRFLHNNGTYRWIQDNSRLVRDRVGNPLEIVGSLVDITDRKLVEEALRQQLEREHLMVEIAQRIRESLDLGAILSTTVAQVQQLLSADRVLVYRIRSDGTGSAIAEAVAPNWSKVLDITFPEEVFPKECYESYIQGRIYTLCDRDHGEILPCLAQFLQEIEVKAKLVVPIIQKDILWGLLITHQCSQPRQWQSWERSWLQQLATQLAIAIQQSELYQQLQVELRDRQKAEEQIKASLAEKELLLKEVHHRVKNNLQVISSLFSLQSQYIQDAKILSIIADSQNRIGAMALIHEKLYQSDSLTKIDFTDYIQNLANNLFASYNISSNFIRFNVRVSDVSLNLDTAIPCGLLINELISNSLKHAFPDKQPGEISINFSVNSQGLLSLLVQDNGVGLPPGLDYQTTNSLGLRLIRALTRQLRGKLEVENNTGAVFRITFLPPKERQRF